MMKRASLRLAAFAVTYCAVELLSFGLHSALNYELLSMRRVHQRREAAVREPQNTEALRIAGIDVPWNKTLHPYFGFGNPPGLRFLAENSHPVQSDSNGVVVAITGGSVASNFYRDGKAKLRAHLSVIPPFRDKNIHVISLAQGAWKQPQQLHAVAYYLAMGGRIDLLINIDGHNEVVDTGFNYQHGVFPAYPWLWYHLSSNVIAPEELAAIGEVAVLKRRRQEIARRFGVFRYSVTLAVVWEAIDKSLRKQINRARVVLQEIEIEEQAGLPGYRSGPKAQIRSWDELATLSARIWTQSSLQLHRLARGNTASYFHFLQPNQYVPNSKTFSAKERRQAFDSRKSGVKRGYPLLIEAAQELLKNGVAFYSLTDVFKSVSDTIYVDTCCHMNPRGSRIMADRIGSIIRAAFETD